MKDTEKVSDFMKRILALICIVVLCVGCGKEPVEEETVYNLFTVEDLGKSMKALGQRDTNTYFGSLQISLIGTITNPSEDSFQMIADGISVNVPISDLADGIMTVKSKEYLEGTPVIVSGILGTIGLECQEEGDLEKLKAEYAEQISKEMETTESTTKIPTEELTTEATTVQAVSQATTQAQTVTQATEQGTEQTTVAVTEETTTETTTTIQELADSVDVDISKLTPNDAPLIDRIRSDSYTCTYRVTMTEVAHIDKYSPKEGDEYTAPMYELEPYEIPTTLTEDQLLESAQMKVINAKIQADKEAEQARIQKEKTRLNNMSIAELSVYIRGGREGLSSPEPNPDKYAPTPMYYFKVTDGNIMGLTDAGKTLKTIIVPDVPVPDNTGLWDDIKASNNVEVLMFKGKHFLETKVPTPETESEKRIREYNKLPQPFTMEYSSDFKVKTAALRGCTSLRILALPYGVDTVGEYAFADCPNLEYVRMPVQAFSLEGHIFDKNKSIVSLIMPEKIHRSYNVEVLYNMYGLTNLIFTSNYADSAGIVDGDMYIFKGCNNLERVAISNTQQFDRSRLENAYKGLDNIVFKFEQRATEVTTSDKNK